MLSKLSVSTLYAIFGNRAFGVRNLAGYYEFYTRDERNQQLDDLVAIGDLEKVVRDSGDVRYYLTRKALETFAPTVSWWAD